MSYDGTWNQSTNGPRIRQPRSGMYDNPSDSLDEDTSAPSGAGMYSQANAPAFGGSSPLDFRNLSSGGQNTVTSGDTSIASVDPNQTGMYQAYTDLLGTGLQTQAQKDVANTNITPAMAKLGIQKDTYFPYLQQLLGSNGIGSGGGSGLTSQLTSSVLQAMNPAREQAALNAADSNASRAAATAQQTGLNQVAGSGWSPASPVGAALTAASQAAKVSGAEDAKRQIRDQFAQQRVTNLAQALNSQNQSMSPIYSLLGSLMN